jgi:hypothetical protein
MEKTEQGTGRMSRSAKIATDTEEPGPRQQRVRREGRDASLGTQPDAAAQISEAREAWLGMIRALARAAAQRDHDAALRTTRSDTIETGERG